MSDDSGFDDFEPIEIDDRSPAERWGASGRAGFERVRGMVDDAHLDAAALVWMLLVLALSAVQVYSALRVSAFGGASGSNDWWLKAELLTGSGGIILILGSLVGIAMAALAALTEGNRAHLALRLAVVGGAWAVCCGILGVVVAFHSGNGLSVGLFDGRGTEEKIVAAVSSLTLGGMGALVAVIAARIDPGSELS